MISIGEGTCVTLHFSLALESGEVVDSNYGKEPASFVFGDGNLPAGFEQVIVGLTQGDEASFQVMPENAFGMPNPNNIQQFKRSEFGPEINLEEGLVLSFSDAANSELPGVVKTIGEEEVTIDFNHPLAGETLTFKVTIEDVKRAESSEGQT